MELGFALESPAKRVQAMVEYRGHHASPHLVEIQVNGRVLAAIEVLVG